MTVKIRLIIKQKIKTQTEEERIKYNKTTKTRVKKRANIA
jgi:hypothetical protein